MLAWDFCELCEPSRRSGRSYQPNKKRRCHCRCHLRFNVRFKNGALPFVFNGIAMNVRVEGVAQLFKVFRFYFEEPAVIVRVLVDSLHLCNIVLHFNLNPSITKPCYYACNVGFRDRLNSG